MRAQASEMASCVRPFDRVGTRTISPNAHHAKNGAGPQMDHDQTVELRQNTGDGTSHEGCDGCK